MRLHGMTSAWLAERTGYSKQAIDAWRQGRRTPRAAGPRHVLASVLGLTLRQLDRLLPIPHNAVDQRRGRRAP